MNWFLLNSGAGEAAANMALDEALLEAASTIGAPVLRFYGWIEPAATFGYFQKHADIANWTTLRPLIRRCTGGGLVPHDADWTYSLVFPPNDPWYALKATESYERVHEWIRRAFDSIGSATELSPCCRKEIPGQCFIGAEQFDVLLGGKKIAGAAQRRTRDGLLIQGSIQPPHGIARSLFEENFCATATTVWGAKWKKLTLEPAFEERVRCLTAEKYIREDYNTRR